MIFFLLLIVAASSCFGAVTNLQVMGSTSTHIVISYTAPTTAPCTVEASRESDYTPLVEDVDTALYTGSNADTRVGSVSNGRHRIFVIGRQGPSAIEAAADGHRRSRALWADTQHYIRVTCGGDQATTVGRTGNIPVGETRGEALSVSPTKLWEYETVTANAAVYPEFADPNYGTRVRRLTNYQNFGFGGSSSTWADGSAPADCNQTLTGVSGSCKFTDATGTGWTATTGTLTDAVRADDSNYAEYSGTTQQPLYIRMGNNKYPISSTGENIGALAWQNKILRLQTTDATGEGGQVELCVTLDSVDCHSPWLKHTLPNTTEATVRFCKDVPCSAAEANGDTMIERYLPYHVMGRNVKMYNVAGTLTTIRFVGTGAQAFCDSLYTSEYIVGTTASLALVQNWITAKSCGSSPPQVTVATEAVTQDYTTNGTAGVGVYTIGPLSIATGAHTGNPRFGILVRKSSTTSSATIKVGYALWRMAIHTPFSLNYGAGGFGKRTQNVLTAQGEYLFNTQNHIVGMSYAADGSMNLTNYGFTYTKGSYLNGTFLLDTGGKYRCMDAGNDTLLSDTEPNVLYCYYASLYNNPVTSTVDNREVLVKVTVTTTAAVAAGNPDAGGSPGLSDKAQRLAITSASILTPCTGADNAARLACPSVDNDYTPYGQRKRFDSTWDPTKFSGCAIEAIQGNLLFERCLGGSQDGHSWFFTYDLGNGLPIGAGFVGTYGNTQQLIAGYMYSKAPLSKWCAYHTFQAPMAVGGAPYCVIEPGDKCPMYFTGTTTLSTCNAFGSPGTCSACPSVTLDGFDYTGKNWCSDFTLTSTWNTGSWGAAPGDYATGDPVTDGCPSISPTLHFWGQKLEVGDFIYQGGEVARIIERTNNTTFKIIRGWGSSYDNSFWNTRSHTNTDVWQTRCGLMGRDPTTSNPEAYGATAWYPALDSTGTNSLYNFSDKYQNHALHVGGVAVAPAYQVGLFDPVTPSTLKTPTNITLYIPWRYGGRADSWNGSDAISELSPKTSCSGNGCEKHPAAGQILGDANAQSWFVDVHPRLGHGGAGTSFTLVAGKTYIYKYSNSKILYPKHFDIEAYTGPFPFRKSDTITDAVGDTGKWCYAVVTNDCFSGSVAGTAYAVFEEFDARFASTASCREAEFGSVQNDGCIGNSAGLSANMSQWRIPSGGGPVFNGQARRPLSKVSRSYRDVATSNNKVDPLGKFIFERGSHYFIQPPFPGISSVAQDDFASIPVTLPSVPAGTNNALIEFGHNSSFQCSRNRDESCYAELETLDQTTPYLFSHENLTGRPCASGCTITVPSLHQRTLYWRVKYRNAGNAVIATGGTNVQAIQ